MAYEKRDGDGALFGNRYKDKDTKPDWLGDVMINGKLWRLAAWNKTTRNGDQFISLKATDPETDDRAPRKQTRSTIDEHVTAQHGGGGLDEDIPFAPDRNA